MKFSEKTAPIIHLEIDGYNIPVYQFEELFRVTNNIGYNTFYFDDYEEDLLNFMLNKKLIKCLHLSDKIRESDYQIINREEYEKFKSEFYSELSKIDLKCLSRERKLKELIEEK